MQLRSAILRLYAKQVHKTIQKDAKNAVSDQQKWLSKIIQSGKNTQFGKDHKLVNVSNHTAYSSQVPIRGYEELRPYIDDILAGKSDILWKGIPKYLAKTSGTTSGVKYLPISHESIKFHIRTASKALFSYLHMTGEDLFSGKVIFISGSPTLIQKASIPCGRLSGIVNHEIPRWLQSNQLPSYATNTIKDWEEKLDKIVDETMNEDLRLISGIPPWVQMYYEKLLEKTGKDSISDIFPNLKVFAYGGVNYAPYRSAIDKLHGRQVPSIETYPASEGFIAYQNDYRHPSLLLNTNAGMFYEFVPLQEINDPSPNRLTLSQVELDKDYAILLTTNAGLWCYNIGDTIRFTSLNPYKVIVSGRIKHFISAFGEHVIGKEVEEAMQIVADRFQIGIHEFTVAPQVSPPEGGLPYHEWFVESDGRIENIKEVEQALDVEIVRQNLYYEDLIVGNVLRPLKIRQVVSGGFRQYMQSIGKLGGQNKVPRLKNDRSLVDKLTILS